MTHALNRLGERMKQGWRDPVAWIEVLQVLKTVGAAVLAWVVAAYVFDLPSAFLAPWSAMLVVHATVYKSFRKGGQQVAAAVVGILLAWAVGTTIGLGAFGLAVLLLLGYAVAQVRWLKEEATTVAATAMFVLTTGHGDNEPVLLGRLLDTAIGVGVGVLVNVLVWPPLRDHAAARAVASIGSKVGELLEQIAEEFGDVENVEDVEPWVRRAQELDEEVDEAWALVRQARESGVMNPRKESRVVREPGSFGDILDRTEQALSEIRSMADTVAHSIDQAHDWDGQFRDRWLGLLRETGSALKHPDADRLGQIRDRLRELALDFSHEELHGWHWPEYGGLILNLRNIATSMDHVAASDPLSETSRVPLRRRAL